VGVTRRQVEIRIEELVLHGFAARDRHRIGAALQRELGRLISQEEVQSLSKRADAQRVDGGTFEAPRGMSPDAVGVQAARAVRSGLVR
jgi:hypothetical protein